MAMKLIHELKTANLFIGCEPESFQDDTFSDFKWPPYRKVSTYDPFEDDPRLAIKNIELDVYDQTLCIGGNSGQVVVFSFRKQSSDVHLQVCGVCVWGVRVLCVGVLYVCRYSWGAFTAGGVYGGPGGCERTLYTCVFCTFHIGGFVVITESTSTVSG